MTSLKTKNISALLFFSIFLVLTDDQTCFYKLSIKPEKTIFSDDIIIYFSIEINGNA